MITPEEIAHAEALVSAMEKRCRTNLQRPDRVYVQVEKHSMRILLQLARVGLCSVDVRSRKL